MKVDISILIILLNDTELNIYKNKIFINYFCNYLKANSIFENCVFIYSGEENEALLNDLKIENKYHVYNIDKISHTTEYQAVGEYLEETKNKCDWFINLDLSNYNPNTIYLSILNINDHYDFIFFKHEIIDLSKYELNSDNKRKYEFLYEDKNKMTINTSLFITKSSFFKECYYKAKNDPFLFSAYFWKGKYKVLEDNGSFSIHLANKQQVDNFFQFLVQIQNQQYNL